MSEDDKHSAEHNGDKVEYERKIASFNWNKMSLDEEPDEGESDEGIFKPSASINQEIGAFEVQMKSTLRQWGRLDPRDGSLPKADSSPCWYLIEGEIKDIAARNHLSKIKVGRYLLNIGTTMLWKRFGNAAEKMKEIQSYIHNTALAKDHEPWFRDAKFMSDIISSTETVYTRAWEIDIEKAGGFASAWGLTQPQGREYSYLMALVTDNAILYGRRMKMISALVEFRKWIQDRLKEAYKKEQIVLERVGRPEKELRPTPLDLIEMD